MRVSLRWRMLGSTTMAFLNVRSSHLAGSASPPLHFRRTVPKSARLVRPSASAEGKQAQSDFQAQLLSSIQGVSGRGQGGLSESQQQTFNDAAEKLEEDVGIEGPTASDILQGRWKLQFTSKPGTESPIQRTFTGVDAFRIYQDIVEDGEGLRIRNVVRFPDWLGALRVEAEGSTDSRQIPGFIPRKGEGLPVFGKSLTTPPDRKDKRIDFWFDRAAFKFSFLPFKIPYPVPFRLFGDETKGWLDVSYLAPDGNFRLSRGNKGTLFVLTKEERSTKQKLLDAIAEGALEDEVLDLIKEIKSSSPTEAPAKSSKTLGKWRVIWSKQGTNANPFQKAFADFRQWQTIEEEAVDNLASIVPGLVRLRVAGSIQPISDTKTEVVVDKFAFEIPGREFPVDVPKDDVGFIKWLYLDDDMRVTTGNRGTMYVHVKE